MRADAELQPRRADRIQVGPVQVLLAEMDKIAAFLDGEPPVVVDDELAAMRLANRLRRADLGAQFGLGAVLDAQLHQPDAVRHQPFAPFRAVEDRVERVKHRRARRGR